MRRLLARSLITLPLPEGEMEGVGDKLSEPLPARLAWAKLVSGQAKPPLGKGRENRSQWQKYIS